MNDGCLAKVKAPKLPRKVPHYLSREEYERLLRAIEADVTLKGGYVKPGAVRWIIDVIKVAVGTGLRLGEICNLRWGAVNLKEGTVTIKTYTFEAASVLFKGSVTMKVAPSPSSLSTIRVPLCPCVTMS